MKNRFQRLLVLLISSLVITMGVFFIGRSFYTLPQYQQQLQHQISEHSATMHRFLDTIQPTNLNFEQHNKLVTQPFTILFYQDHQLTYWNNNSFQLTTAQLDSIRSSDSDAVLSGLHAFRQIHFLYLYRPLRNNTAVLTAMPLAIPDAFQLANDSTFPLLSANGQIMASLEGPEVLTSHSFQRIVFLGTCLSIIFLVLCLHQLASRQRHAWVGGSIIMSFIVIFQFLPIADWIQIYFYQLKGLQQFFSIPVLSTSLGQLLISSILLLWLMSFFHREFELKKEVYLPKSSQYILSFLNYLTIILGFVILTNLFQSFVVDSDLIFDFDQVFKLNIFGLFAMLSAVFLLFAFFLFTHRMMRTLVHIGLSRNQRLQTLIGALLLMGPILIWTTTSLPLLQMLLLTMLYILLFDLFVESGPPTLTWMLIWMLFFAAYTAVLLFKFNLDKDQKSRLAYAQALSQPSDSLAYSAFQQILHDTTPLNLNYLTDKYLDHYYQLQSVPKNTIDLNKYQRNSAGIWQAKSWATAYPFLATYDSVHYLALQPKERQVRQLIQTILPVEAYKNQASAESYDFLVTHQGKVRTAKGSLQHLQPLPAPGTSVNRLSSSRALLTYHAPNGSVVSVAKDMGGYIKPMSLFSYLYVLLLIAAFGLLLVARLTHSLPESLNLPILSTTSLKSRIHLVVIGLIIGAFIIIGWATISSFRDSEARQYQNQISQRLGTVLRDLEHELQLYQEKNDTIDLRQIPNQLSEIHHVDINTYDLNGKLLASSLAPLYEQQQLLPRMHPTALKDLQFGRKALSPQDETLDNHTFKTIYIPLRTNEDTFSGYLGLPYEVEDSWMDRSFSDFIGTLLNVYVFLLFIAGGIAIAVANSITKPITAIGEKFKSLKLGRNEPLEWESEDEIGALIKAYNNMIDQLEESTEKLKQSEREGAWREMAKQVAHEIKNPLTPMKLSIQYLIRVAQSDPDRVKEMLPRVSQTLVEQIEGLARIATEFSNFAKMPQAKNSHFRLNDVVRSVYHLFTEVPQDDLHIDLHATEEELEVFADRENLMRVLNNLVKNAIQAIPDTRKGHLQIKLLRIGKKAQISVKDNGTGISEELQEKVFYPNFTTKNSGMGLGLAISKNIIDAAGGRIYFETEYGKGTTFFIELPLQS